MTDNLPPSTSHFSIQELLGKTTDTPKNPDVYSNYVQFLITQNELFIDLYYISPTNAFNPTPRAEFTQRIVLPHSLAKGFVTAMANAIDVFEKDTETEIPNKREKVDTENIIIWPDKK